MSAGTFELCETFLQSYVREVCDSIGNDHQDNYDTLRFGPEPVARQNDKWSLGAPVRELIRRRGYDNIGLANHIVQKGIDFISPVLPRLEWLWTLLADDNSREVLVKVMAYRALGYRKVKLPINTPELWEGVNRAEALMSPTDRIDSTFESRSLGLMDMSGYGFPVKLYYYGLGAHAQFGLQQYRCETPAGAIEAVDGDHVIDAGACWGDTALYFAAKIGVAGRVFAFELAPENLAILAANLEKNPELAGKIEIVNKALWNVSDEELTFTAQGPGTHLNSGKDEGASRKVMTKTIDDFVREQDLPHLDFIKMDIEGAELAALHGAEATIRQHLPKLAITVYHRLEDFFTIPDFLQGLDLGYRFYLRHFSIHAEETVLFAWRESC